MGKQHAGLFSAITGEKKVEEIEKGVELLTMQFFKDYFQPRGYGVAKVDVEMTDGKSLNEIRDAINGELGRLLADNNDMLAETRKKVDLLDREIHEDIRGKLAGGCQRDRVWGQRTPGRFRYRANFRAK
jgi:hypothetical protein